MGVTRFLTCSSNSVIFHSRRELMKISVQGEDKEPITKESMIFLLLFSYESRNISVFLICLLLLLVFFG